MASSPAQLACDGNLLVDPGFEDGFTARGRPSEVVAHGWSTWYERLPGVGGINYVPDFVPRNRDVDGSTSVASGRWSQEMATHDATHTAGLWQRVAVPPGSVVAAWISVYAWATNGADARRSEPPGTYVLALGLDPAAGSDPAAATVAWTTPISVTDVWVPLAIEVAVPGDAVTLFTRGQPLEVLRHNVSRWDDACVRVVGPIGQPTPTPTDRPWPTPAPSADAAAGTALARDVRRATRDALQAALAIEGATLEASAALPQEAGSTSVGVVSAPVASADVWSADAFAPDDAADLPVGEVAAVILFGTAALLAGLAAGIRRTPQPAPPDTAPDDEGTHVDGDR